MKIVNRKTFLGLPSGTVYSKCYEDDGFGDLSVKTETKYDGENAIDWLYFDINDFDFHDTCEERYYRINEMKKNKKEYPLMLNCVSRDGMFEDEMLFAIYDKDDVLNIIKTLCEALRGFK